MATAEVSATHLSTRPTLADIEVLDDDNEDEETHMKREKERSFWTKIWQSMAAGSFGLSIAAIAIVQSAVVIVMGLIAMGLAAIVFKCQMDLQDTDSMRRLQNFLRQDVNRLQVENNKLGNAVTELESNVTRLGESEDRLDSIVQGQDTNVKSLVRLVKENGEILNKMKSSLELEAFQQLVAVVMASDSNQDSVISENEINILMLRLQSVPGVEVNGELFKEKIRKSDGSLVMVVDIVKQLYNKDIPEEDRIFKVDTNALAQ